MLISLLLFYLHVFSRNVWSSKPCKDTGIRENRNRLTDIENKFMITKGKGEGRDRDREGESGVVDWLNFTLHSPHLSPPTEKEQNQHGKI